MSRPVPTYESLELERRELEIQLQEKKEKVLHGFREIKKHAEPLTDLFSTVSDFATRDKKAWLLGMGADALIDLFVRDILLSKTNKLVKMVVPVLLKNYTSHILAEHQEKWGEAIAEWLGNENGNSNGHENNVH